MVSTRRCRAFVASLVPALLALGVFVLPVTAHPLDSGSWTHAGGVSGLPTPAVDRWVDTAADLSTLLASAGLVSSSGWLYAIGGEGPATGQAVNLVQRAAIQSDGSLATWSAMAAPYQMPVPLYWHAVASSGTHLYVIGGWDGSLRHTEVWHAQVDPSDGTFSSTWTKVADYPMAVALHSAVASNGYLYVAGGDTGAVKVNSVYYAQINPTTGSLGPWQGPLSPPQTGTPALYRLSVTAANSTLYITGGYNGTAVQDKVYASPIATDGSLGSWTTSTLPAPREYHQALPYRGYLVLVGGRTTGSVELKSVEAAPISPGGSLGAWAPAGREPDLLVTLYRFGAATAVAGGFPYIYLGGGINGGVRQPEVYRSRYRPQLTVSLAQVGPGSALSPDAPPNPKLTYTIALENGSAGAACAIFVTSPVPAGTSFDSCTDGCIAVDPVSWAILGPLNPAATVEVAFTVSLNGTGPVANSGACVQWQDCDDLAWTSLEVCSPPLFLNPWQAWLPVTAR